MFKTIFKETAIILLLIMIIALVLGVTLYDYIPTGKVVPIIESYEIPDNIKNEVNESIQDNESQTVITYQINEQDLINYEQGKDYQKGKINPFSKNSSGQATVETGSTSTPDNNNPTPSDTTTNNNNTAQPDNQNTGLK